VKRNRPLNYVEWLAENPPPDLQAIVTACGDFGDIPGEVWAKFTDDMADWQYRRRHRHET
jgi:hypothetical protein